MPFIENNLCKLQVFQPIIATCPNDPSTLGLEWTPSSFRTFLTEKHSLDELGLVGGTQIFDGFFD